MKRALVLFALSSCQVVDVGDRLFACGDDGGCAAGFTCSVEDGLCLRTGELCTGAIPLDDGTDGPFDVTVQGDLSQFSHDQDLDKCSPAARGADVFYSFAGSGPFIVSVDPVGDWRPMVSVQKCDVNVSENQCKERTFGNAVLGPGFWKVAVSSVTGGGPFALRVRGVALEPGDYCGSAVRLNFAPGADGGLVATSQFDSTPLVPYTQSVWACTSGTPQRDVVFFAPARADGGVAVARTDAPFPHWVMWRVNNVSCTAADAIRCIEATDQGDGGWRAVATGKPLSDGPEWLWVGSAGDGGRYDVRVELR